MPENARDDRWQARLLAAGILCGTLFVPAAAQAQEDAAAATAQSGADPATQTAEQADDGAVKPIVGEVPDDPREAYLVQQHRMVQALRRIDNSLLTPKVLTDYQKHYRDYRQLLGQGTNGRSPKEMEILKAGIAYKVYSLAERSIQEDPADLENALKTLRRDMDRAGSAITNNQQKAAFRELFMTEMVGPLKQLLQNNLIARSLAIEVMPDMVVEQPGVQARRIRMFEPVDDLLVEIVNSDEQPDAIKGRAANSITNYLQKSDSIPQTQMKFARALATQLELPFTEPAYQEVLLTALEAVQTPRELIGNKEPIQFCIAAKLMEDTSRDIQIRCHAASIFGRSGFDPQTNFDVVAWATARLGVETAARFDNAKDKSDARWQYAGFYLYTTFHHWERNEVNEKKGLLNRSTRSENVRAAWEKLLPVAVHMMGSTQKVPTKAKFGLFQWVEGNKPTDLRFDPACPPFNVLGDQAGTPSN
ncbi:MAG: hypothetical protein Fues2KO_05430 [Fuerstiella sp.]